MAAKAQSPAGATEAAQRSAKRGGGSWLWLQGLLCGAVAMLAPPSALLLGVLLAPAALGAMLDRQVGKPVARCIGLAGLAACVLPLLAFWQAGLTMDSATAILADPVTVGTAWSAAAAGWLLAELAPVIVRMALEAGSRMQARRLRAEHARLGEAWDDPPNGAA